MTTPVITTSLADRTASVIAALTVQEHEVFSSVSDPISSEQAYFLRFRTLQLNCLKSMGQFSGDVFAPLDFGAAYDSSPRASAHILATEPGIAVIRLSQKGPLADLDKIFQAYTDLNWYPNTTLATFHIQRDIINPTTHEHVGYAFFRKDPVQSSSFCVPFDVIDGGIRPLLFEVRWSDDDTPAIQTHLGLRSANALEALAAEEITLFADWNGVDAPTAAQADFLNRRVFALTSLTGLGQFTDDVFGPLNAGGPPASILGLISIPVGSRPLDDLGMTGFRTDPIVNPDPAIGQVGMAVFALYLRYFWPSFKRWGSGSPTDDQPPYSLILEFRWSDQ